MSQPPSSADYGCHECHTILTLVFEQEEYGVIYRPHVKPTGERCVATLRRMCLGRVGLPCDHSACMRW